MIQFLVKLIKLNKDKWSQYKKKHKFNFFAN